MRFRAAQSVRTKKAGRLSLHPVAAAEQNTNPAAIYQSGWVLRICGLPRRLSVGIASAPPLGEAPLRFALPQTPTEVCPAGRADCHLLPVGRADGHLLPVGRADYHLLPVGRADGHLLPPNRTRIREA